MQWLPRLTEEILHKVLRRQNHVLRGVGPQVPLAEHDLVGCALAPDEMRAGLRQREVRIARDGRYKAGVAGIAGLGQVDGRAGEVGERFVPHGCVEDVCAAEVGVLAAREVVVLVGCTRPSRVVGSRELRELAYLRLASCSRMLWVVRSSRLMTVAFGSGLVGCAKS